MPPDYTSVTSQLSIKCSKHGLDLDKVRRGNWVRPKCMVNTIHRVQHPASNQGKEQFREGPLKLVNNSVFRKMMENIRNHRDINLVTNKEAYLKRVMKPNFKSGIFFSENLIGCEMGKIRVVMNKPVYLGQAILDLNKIAMYAFHYDYMKPKHGANLWLSYMDTDSQVYDIKTDDFYADITGDVKARFNTSGYSGSRVHLLPTGVNKKVIGFMKDKLGRWIMTKFVALRPKLHAYKTLGWSEDKKCAVKKMLDFEDYKQCLNTNFY